MYILEQLLINTVFAIITTYLTCEFLKVNFNVTIKRNIIIIFSISVGVLNGLISTLWMSVLNIPLSLQFMKSIILTIINIVIIKFFFKIEWIKSILAFCIIIIFMGIGNATVAPIFYMFGIEVSQELINNNPDLFLIMNIIIYIVTFILIKLSTYTKMLSNIRNLKPIGFLLIITVIVMASYFGVYYAIHYDPVSLVVSLISSLIYFISTVWYISIYHRYEMQKEEQHQQMFYNESLANTLEDLRRLKHDHTNHLTVLYAMYQMKKYEAAELYLKEILELNENLGNTAIYNIKNAGLFGIISAKMNYADSQGIAFNLKVIDVVDSIPDIRISELCEVIGIYLDNAIEEVLNNGKMKIEMQMENTEKSLIITINNECTEIPILEKSKKGADRGNGLIIANKILSSYKNIFNTTSFNKDSMTFSQVISIAKEA
ncbi:two-component system sensor histidine kinase AgrC [Ruminiclostridium sufflavum DSM 19573]|uniref:Two-component system sensor histidine kinase AgrC n=1 Tax=Ruminiclostridium sufflavum DSM 19573 TaxID=1121337 RepID=A0A318XNV0_9FIRM|nr:GHKL domain-containing protein [Ruminiclostridium sufflavum]PYG88695.1 two-component system sensor histidine kinase AgrC [Ruminiclostridium sufflavum DSM 19573]